MAKRGRPKKRIGDKIAEVTKAVGIEPCDNCKKRQAKLNELHENIEYWFKKFSPKPMSKEQLNDWETFRNNDKNELSTNEQQLILDLTKHVFNMSFKICGNCSSSVYKKHIARLNTAYEQQTKK